MKPSTALGAALVQRRCGRTLEEVSAELNVNHSTLSRLERGAHRPSADTALILARWLGWSVEQVLEAAKQPPPTPDAPPADHD